MTDLEIYSAYLPYDLMLFDTSDNSTNLLVSEAKNLNQYPIQYVVKYSEICKPILRPLSDLEKNFTDYFDAIDYDYVINLIKGKVKYLFINYGVIKILLKNHFDVFGLIEQRKAIDINTL